jgi:hypothetical protein
MCVVVVVSVAVYVAACLLLSKVSLHPPFTHPISSSFWNTFRAKELASKQQQQQSSGVSKFDYLIGQSEVFAHFLAGESPVSVETQSHCNSILHPK